ncbi:poly-gamma-glutamate hydrolase family protein [Paracoccaceae bacterium GXU_MW_L88]
MADRYNSFYELSAKEKLDIDYKIRVSDCSSDVLILAPHGGFIEPGTSEIAEKLAGDNFSFYAFESLKRKPHSHFHITSHRFDEPKALSLVCRSLIAVAIHGRSNDGTEVVWLGGLATALRDAIGASLRKAGFSAEFNQRLAGLEPNNICNRALSGKGVQLELPRSLRDRLMADPNLLQAFADAVRTALYQSIE